MARIRKRYPAAGFGIRLDYIRVPNLLGLRKTEKG